MLIATFSKGHFWLVILSNETAQKFVNLIVFLLGLFPPFSLIISLNYGCGSENGGLINWVTHDNYCPITDI